MDDPDTLDRSVVTAVTLRPLGAADEDPATRAHAELAADGFSFLLGWEPGLSWARYLDAVEGQRLGRDLPEGWVPATFLVAEVEGHLAGRVSIRHRLNPHLEAYVGHIGYGVRPAFRRRGLATTMLRRSLELARHVVEGDRVLLTCDDGNLASATVIERCGGVLEDRRHDPFEDVLKRRYWIDLAG